MAHIAVTLSKYARRIGVRTAYGDPVTVGTSTVLPVAIGWYGFGGGGDQPDEHGDFAGGGGGGGASVPIGAYVGDPSHPAAFEPNVIALLAASTPVVWATGVALSRVIRALKK